MPNLLYEFVESVRIAGAQIRLGEKAVAKQRDAPPLAASSPS